VYIPPLGLLGLGFGCPSPVVGAELEAGFAAVRCAVEGVAAVVALVLFLVVLRSALLVVEASSSSLASSTA
jgi:hypothetical protein